MVILWLCQDSKHELVSQGSLASIEISVKIKPFGYTFLVCFTVLFDNQGCYYNSLIMQALELPPLGERSELVPVCSLKSKFQPHS